MTENENYLENGIGRESSFLALQERFILGKLFFGQTVQKWTLKNFQISPKQHKNLSTNV